MGNFEFAREEKFDHETKTKEPKKRSYVACLWSFLVSLSGGLLLAWWEHEYHPTYSQLWMVPVGLILFGTPVMIWFAISVSHFCKFTEDASPSVDGSSLVHQYHDPEKMIKQVI
ncbi:hypothetical protein COLO4_06217 [Corchorus olitorius]|uniref:Uncharacterized protein n=1 Tax=Corchorus olitorius TaxID=93759 RepID=A0A1R3KNM7_9ROSI|nr:hypothetical protein COLO4_06217 [Corchorus olitorius]